MIPSISENDAVHDIPSRVFLHLQQPLQGANKLLGGYFFVPILIRPRFVSLKQGGRLDILALAGNRTFIQERRRVSAENSAELSPASKFCPPNTTAAFPMNHPAMAAARLALGSFVREQVEDTADENSETHVPGWLDGLVTSYDDIGITMRRSSKKSN